MELKFFCPRWGSENLTWEEFLFQVKGAGYDGLEWGIDHQVTETEMSLVWNLAEKINLLIIPQHYATYSSNFNQHRDLYKKWLDKMQAFPSLKINSQTGKDFFTFNQNKELISLASEFTSRTGCQVFHETHRNKFSFAAHVTHDYLLAIPRLRLTLDLSHWVTVAESYLVDQQNAVELALQRTGHIHARVGYPEGPQIPDLRAPEWKEAVEIHLNWWINAYNYLQKKGEKVLTVTPEFGPYPYLINLPFSNQPIANQWDMNKFMMQLVRNRLTNEVCMV